MDYLRHKADPLSDPTQRGSPYLWIMSLHRALASSHTCSVHVGVGFSPSRVGVHYLKEILTGPKGLDIIKVHFQMFKGQCPNGQHAWVGSSSLAGVVLGTSHTARTDLNTQGWELRNEIVAAQKAPQRTFFGNKFSHDVVLPARFLNYWRQRVFGLGASSGPPFLLFFFHLQPIDLLPWYISRMEAILVP